MIIRVYQDTRQSNLEKFIFLNHTKGICKFTFSVETVLVESNLEQEYIMYSCITSWKSTTSLSEGKKLGEGGGLLRAENTFAKIGRKGNRQTYRHTQIRILQHLD